VADKSDFTEEEWKALHKGAVGAGMLVAVADPGFFDTLKEATALAKHVANARKESPSQLVRQLAETGGGTGFGLTASPTEVESETTASLQTAKQALEAKAPDELAAYRRFVLDIARSVGAAAEGGEAKEAEAVHKIESILA
jgi:hypothetical protein